MADKSYRSLAIIFFTVFIDLIGFGIIIPVLQPYARFYGATDLEAGLLMGVFSGVQFFIIPVWGWLSDRMGRKPIILAGLFGSCLSYIILATAPNLTMLFVGRILAGLSAGNLVAAQAYIADVTPPEKRAHGMGIIGVAYGLGFILGPVIGGILSRYSFHHPSYVAALASGLAFLYGLIYLKESLPVEKRPKHAPMRHPILNLSKVINETLVFKTILANFLFTISFAMWETVFVLFVANKILAGLSENELSRKVGMLYAFAGLFSAFVQGGAIRHLVKAYGEKTIAQCGFFLQILGCLGFIAVDAIGWPDSVTGLLPLLALIGAGSGCVSPTVSSMVSKLVSPMRQGEVFGAFRGVGSLARVIGPVAGAFLFASVAHTAPYMVGIALMTGAILLLIGPFPYWQEE